MKSRRAHFIFLCFIFPQFGNTAIAAPPQATDIIWFETPVAEISVGYDFATKQTRQRTFYLAYVGPPNAFTNPTSDPTAAMRAARACTETVKSIRTQLQNALASSNYDLRNLPPSQLTQRRISATNTALLTLANARRGEFFACIRARGFTALQESDFHLTLVQRNCTPATCPLSGTRERLSDDEQTIYFAALYEWMSSKVGVESRTATGLLLRLDTLTNPDASVSLKADVTVAKEVNLWLPNEGPVAASSHFAALVSRVRDARGLNGKAPRISAFAPTSLGFSRTDLLVTADTLSSAISAYALTPTSVADRLTSVSNEMARSQIFECRYFQGNKAAASVSNCSGLALDEQQLQTCLSGGLCRPNLVNQPNLASLMEGAPLSLDQIAKSNPFPRMSTDLKTMQARYDTCNQPGRSPNEANVCFMNASFEADAKLRPLRSCISLQTSTAQTRCALRQVSPGSETVIRCVEGQATDAMTKCLAAQYLPDKYQAIYDCLSASGQRDRLAACGSQAGGDAGKLASCLRQSQDTLVIATCVAGDRLPKPIKDAVSCLVTNSRSLAQAGVCVAATQVSPKLARQIGCVVESRGSPMGAGVCIATSSLDLTPEQQLALQCLASTGGQPYAFAVCFGGQLTLREMANCRGKSFGEDNCFGPNNEFQKVAKALTGRTIGPNSVVGQVLTVGITPATYVVQVAQPIVDTGMQSLAESIDNVKKGIEALTKGDFGGLAETAVNELTSPLRHGAELLKGLRSLL